MDIDILPYIGQTCPPIRRRKSAGNALWRCGTTNRQRPPSCGPIWPCSTMAATAGISKPWGSLRRSPVGLIFCDVAETRRPELEHARRARHRLAEPGEAALPMLAQLILDPATGSEDAAPLFPSVRLSHRSVEAGSASRIVSRASSATSGDQHSGARSASRPRAEESRDSNLCWTMLWTPAVAPISSSIWSPLIIGPIGPAICWRWRWTIAITRWGSGPQG